MPERTPRKGAYCGAPTTYSGKGATHPCMVWMRDGGRCPQHCKDPAMTVQLTDKQPLVERVAEHRGQGTDLVKLGDELAKEAGGPGLLVSHTLGVCSWCGKPVKGPEDFDDELSLKEWKISRCCQACQNQMFAEPDDEEDGDAPAF